jgi:KDO2-lipid IV(A) lauroyltransferase
LTAVTRRHRRGALAYRATRALVRLLPHAAARWAGRRLGDLGYALDRRHRRRALAQLAAAFPDLDPAGRRRIARRAFRHLGSAAADGLSAGRFDLVELCRRLTLEGWDHLQAAEAAGRGVLVLTGHLGLWEVVAWAVGAYAGPVHALGRPLANPRLAAEHARTAERFGLRLQPERSATGEMAAALAAGEKVAAVIDRPPPPGADRVAVPFLGRPIEVSSLPARLALQLGAPAVPVFALPAPRGRYRLIVRPGIQPPNPGTAADPDPERVAALTARYLAALEAEVRRRPDLWPWGALGG